MINNQPITQSKVMTKGNMMGANVYVKLFAL